MDELATLFIDPIRLNGLTKTWLMLPICLSISIVYKTIKSPTIREIPVASLGLCISIVAGMGGVALAMWLLYLIFA